MRRWKDWKMVMLWNPGQGRISQEGRGEQCEVLAVSELESEKSLKWTVRKSLVTSTRKSKIAGEG